MWVYVCMSVRKYVFHVMHVMYAVVCIYVYICVHTYAYVCIHVHTYVGPFQNSPTKVWINGVSKSRLLLGSPGAPRGCLAPFEIVQQNSDKLSLEI